MSIGIRRTVRREIEKALNYVGGEKPARCQDVSEADAIHEIRKRFKKVRAALRLVRAELGDEVYREENWCFRDAARPLAQARDAAILFETLEKIGLEFADQVDKGDLAKVHDALCASHKFLIRRLLDDEQAFAAVKGVATRAIGRISEWKIDHDGWEALERGLRRVYRMGHKALALATESSSVVNLHEWRKQTKYLWHQLQLLEAGWTGPEKDLSEQFHTLSRLLGEDHDLAVFRLTLAADPLTYAGHRFLKNLFVLIDRKRLELERQAFILGRQLYGEQPKIFTSRIGAYWTASAGKIKLEEKRIPSRPHSSSLRR